MPRVKDIAWKFVTRLEGDKWRCPYCENEYFGKVTRVKSHFLQIPNRGISFCTKVPGHIRELMRCLPNQVSNKDDITWRFVNRMEDNKWRCYHCNEVFCGDLTRVKGHLLRFPNEGIPICPGVPDHITTLMKSLLGEAAEEESREATSSGVMPIQVAETRSSTVSSPTLPVATEFMTKQTNNFTESDQGPPFEDIFPGQSVAQNSSGESITMALTATEEQSRGAAEGQSREAHGQSSVAPLSRDRPTEAEVAEEESREADSQIDSWIVSPRADHRPSQSFEDTQTLLLAPEFAELSVARISDGDSVPCPTMALAAAESGSHLHDLPDQPQRSIPSQMQIDDQQIPAGASSSQYDQLPDLGNLNCLQNCYRHSQLQMSMDKDPSIASQHTSGSHISEAPNLELQVPAAATNAIGPSSSQATVSPQRQSVSQPSINHETRDAPQNPTVPSSSRNIHSVTVTSLQETPHNAPMELGPHMLPSSQAPHNAPPLPQIPTYGTALMFPYPSSDMTTGAPMTSHQETAKNFEKIGVLKKNLKRLRSVQADIKDELEYAVGSLSLKKPRKEVVNWLADVDKLRNDFPWTESVSEDRLPSDKEVDVVMLEAEELIMRESNFSHGLFEARVMQFTKFIEAKMVGEAFQRNTTKILEYLVGDQVSRLGIYGMGGVGKTTIMRYIHNRLLEKANYGNVLWVTVSQDFNPQKLQDVIWKALHSRELKETDLGKRAAMLSDCLTERGKSTIILDDMWKDFDLEEVGIPIRADGFKLVLTSRSSDVCCKMQCQEKIKIEPLSREEAESLFFEELVSEAALNSEVEVVAKSMVRECDGLPLGVITMARSMRGVTDMFEWEDTLEKLKKSDMGQTEMESKVLRKLKVSYDRLDNHVAQQCFLSCALYPKYYPVKYNELIEFFIDQGLFDKLDTRKKQYRRGFTVLNKLKNACLLEDDGRCIVMHDLIRDMALHIMSMTSIVKVGHESIRIPSEDYWTDVLENICLMDWRVVQFPLNLSPNCPKLSIIILKKSLFHDDVIPDSFFKHLRQLKVLNLSGCCQLRELPSSMSDLVNLRALLLAHCSQLRHIPHLRELGSLRKLDVVDCHNLEALNGLGMLVNLRYLNLIGTKIEMLPKGTLGGLKNLQWLLVNSVHVEDFANVWPLELFEGKFKGANEFNKLVSVTWEKSNPPYYSLQEFEDVISISVGDEPDDVKLPRTRMVEIDKMRDGIVSVRGESTEERTLIIGKSTDDFILIPHDVQELTCRKDDCITDLSGMYPLENLERLCIEDWEKLRVLCGGPDKDVIGGHDSRAITTAPLLFPSFTSLEKLEIFRCRNLKYLFGHGSKFDLPHLQCIKMGNCGEMRGITVTVAPPPPHPSPAFPSLTVVSVWNCGKMKRVVEPEWLPHFPKLSIMSVGCCDEMEELIGVPPPYTRVEEMSFECLTKKDALNMARLSKIKFPLPLRSSVAKFFHVQVEQGQERSTHNAPSSSHSSISLPKLTYLWLYGMARLKSICESPIFYDPMNVLEVGECPGLSFANCS